MVQQAERNSGRIVILDGWRGLAILSVLFGHFITGQGLNMGRVGVELFFVLSGRLMAQILFVDRMPLTTFFPRRLARIYPTLFVFVTAIFLASQLFPWARVAWPEYFAAVLLYANYWSIYNGQVGVLGHIWSLCVEEHMYILLGGIALLERRLRLPTTSLLLGLAACAAFWGAHLTLNGNGYYQVYWRSDVRGASILAGAAAYLLLKDHKVPSWLPLGALLGGLAFSVGGVPDPVKYTLGTALFATAVTTLPQMALTPASILSSATFVQAGMWSYSLYLWQQPFYMAGQKLHAPLLALPLAVAVGIASFLIIETPTRRWLVRQLTSRAPRALPA